MQLAGVGYEFLRMDSADRELINISVDHERILSLHEVS